jgi:hypothetical protein
MKILATSLARPAIFCRFPPSQHRCTGVATESGSWPILSTYVAILEAISSDGARIAAGLIEQFPREM